MEVKSRLRDLAAQIEDLAREHPAYSQAWQPIRNLVDHLSALALVEEANANQFKPVNYRDKENVKVISERRATMLRECRRIFGSDPKYAELSNWIDDALAP